jgi:hypothetical protein
MRTADKAKIEYGDFQTPIELADKICQKLVELGVKPDVVIEPTCGIGAFIKASACSFKSLSKIIGIEINPEYICKINQNNSLFQHLSLEVSQGNFFEINWFSLIEHFSEPILVIGNFPWVTNSQQGIINGLNMPEKNNFQNYSGLDAITGKSNFDISEWMLIQAVEWLQNRNGYLAMICKTSVARKLLKYIHVNKRQLAYGGIFGIDAKKYFGVSVEACLLFCKFDSGSHNYLFDVFENLETKTSYRIGYKNGITIRNLADFEELSNLYGSNEIKWRSGIKHDCSQVMEFHQVNDNLINGLGEIVDIEKNYLFPLLKGSDVANNRIAYTKRYILVTQQYIGESTDLIKNIAPKTWYYLESHANYLDRRKSKIYYNNPRFSIFGVGNYTFAPWKIAICGLYKSLDFRLINQINNKPVVFDDTIYFLSFCDEQVARKTFQLLTSSSAIRFFSSLIFWDEKRPIKASILNSLNLRELEKVETFTLFGNS